jgi:hypothetical protein
VYNHKRVNEIPLLYKHEIQFSAIKTHTDIGQSLKKKYLMYCHKNKVYPVGFLPWKLMCTDVLLVDKDSSWKETIEKDVVSLISELHDINKQENPIESFYKKYPRKISCSNDPKYVQNIKKLNSYMESCTYDSSDCDSE